MESFKHETLYSDLEVAAIRAGTNISQLCKDAKVPRNTVQKWKEKPPKSFVILGQLFAAIEAKKPKPDAAV